MGAIKQKSLFILLARLVIAGVFISAALPKIQDPIAFAVSVSGFRVTGPELSAWIALFLPWLELVLGVGIVIPEIRRCCGALISLLLLAFITLHISAWARGLDISCGCFGAETGETGSDYRWLILRNLALLIASILALRQDLRNKDHSSGS